MSEEKLAQVVSYLEAEFPDHRISCLNAYEGETLILIRADGDVHNVRLQQSFLDRTTADEVVDRLKEFRLTATLRDIGDFQIAVTVSGCIFA